MQNPDTGADVGVSDAGADIQVDAAADAAPDTTTSATPALSPYSDGECPRILRGDNTLSSGGVDRQLEVYLPDNPVGSPIVFYWYGAGGSSQSSYSWLQPFATAYDVTIVVPRAAPNMLFEWPIISTNDPGSELVFFDDIVACVSQEMQSDLSRIYTTGFSAGALWSTTLVMQRSDVLAAAVLYSGGTGDYVHDYQTPAVPIPILGLHGGANDIFGNGIINFKDRMTDLFDNLEADDHFLLACDHGGGHTIPAGGLDWGIEFMLAHQYGDTSSPYEVGVPDYLPSYCDYWPLE